MELSNQTSHNEFIFLGITNNFKMQVLLFVTFSLIYTVTILGNFGITTLILVDRQLHSPMYFFLMKLSCVDLGCSTTLTPKTLATLFFQTKVISFSDYATQNFFFAVFGGCVVILLFVMAYDRYVAICNPLLYPIIINQSTCVHLLCPIYLMSLLNAGVQTSVIFSLSFCKSNVIAYFFCDLPPLLKLSCSKSSLNKEVLLIYTYIFGIGSVTIIVTSYCFIISTILRIPSEKWKHKAFSTYTSHVTIVSLCYGPVFIIYLQPATNSVAQTMAFSLFLTVVIPMLNPMIYSRRNQEVKRALRKCVAKVYSQGHPLRQMF